MTAHGRRLRVTYWNGVQLIVADAERELSRVRADALSQPQRRAVWDHIRAQDPQLAQLMQDPIAQQLREEMGATPVFGRPLVDAALAAAGLPGLGV